MEPFNTSEMVSYRHLVDSHIYKIGVLRSDIKVFRLRIHKLLAYFGIITFDSLAEDRKKPYQNSPYGKFVNYHYENGKRHYIRSYILNNEGIAHVSKILSTYVSEPYLFKNQIITMKDAQKEIQNKVNHKVLRHWLDVSKLDYQVKDKSLSFVYEKKRYTYYLESNLIVGPEKKTNKPFWFILNAMSMPEPQSIAKTSAEIVQAHYEIAFNEYSDVWREGPKTLTVKSKRESELEERITALEAAIKRLSKENNEKEIELTEIHEKRADGIKSQVRSLVKPLTKRPYLINIEEYAEQNSIFVREQMKRAFDCLKDRKLINAVNAPTWKYNFNENSIDILARIDKRASAVFDVRHRLLDPVLLSDGSIMKEKAEKEEGDKRFKIPFGLERINYRNKFIFVCEGYFDSCFIKNAIAITTCIMPHDMRKVIDIYRQNGFVIVHIPDNFRAGDKGGKAALREYLKKDSDIFHEEDLVFDWSVWPDFKDINEVAVKINVDEISQDTILKHCWNSKTIHMAKEFID